ncbi:MAG: glycosyltransferase [Pyrinomonadaceae bacterium]|nr:glycosyltransferase [Pyrinomonadaceae bacterium]
MKKNALQFIGSFHQGGSERQAVQLTQLLHEDDVFQVFVATLSKRGTLLKEVEELGLSEIPEYKLNSFFNLNFLRQIKKCAGFLRKNKIEIVHTHDFYTNIFGVLAARYAGVPVKIASKRETRGLRTNLQIRAEKLIFRMADAVTVNSEAVKRYLGGKGIYGEKIEVIYNGLDIMRLKPKETDREKICTELGLPTNPEINFVTLVANLRHGVKNQPMLLRVAKHLKEEFPNTHFVFAGEGERKNFLMSMAERLGVSETTHFIDRCRIVPELLSISYACVLTSFAEGFSNSILEYMSAAKPVVATNVGGASEAIIEGMTGFLVESNDDEAMAKHLTALLKNPERAKAMGQNGREVVTDRFICESQLESVTELYLRKLDGR